MSEQINTSKLPTLPILHGSPFQHLKVIKSVQGRFGRKIFASYNLQRALRYIADFENGGDSVLDQKDGKLYVLNTNPQNLINAKGSLYLLNPSGFIFDPHKGEKNKWVFSKEGKCEVYQEIPFNSVLEA